MDAYVLDSLSLCLRWLHVVTAMAWIGASFYFVFLDSNLTPPQDESLQRQGATGELWAVHGGGFYHPVKFAVAPAHLPPRLHWFYWESYSTWMSGFALLCITYLVNARVYLIDPALMDWSPAAAVAAALGLLVGFWCVYDVVCRCAARVHQRCPSASPAHQAARARADALAGVAIAASVVWLTWLACHWFAGRAAFVLVGAAMATAMTANVWIWIIPGQRTVVAALRAGQLVDPVHGQRGKQRSVHNTYFTLPVLVAMLSNHYGFAHAHPFNAAVLLGLMLAGALVRRFFVLRHGYHLGRCRHPWPWLAAGLGLLLATLVWTAPSADTRNAAAAATIALPTPTVDAGAVTTLASGDPHAEPDAQQRQHLGEQALSIVAQRCVMCHGAQLAMKNIRLDTPELVRQHAAAIYQQAVVQRTMPMNNATHITPQERATLGLWFDSGAHTGPLTAPAAGR